MEQIRTQETQEVNVFNNNNLLLTELLNTHATHISFYKHATTICKLHALYTNTAHKQYTKHTGHKHPQKSHIYTHTPHTH